MLLYNNQKTFIGVDEFTLRKLGFNNLLELKEDVQDFADLFDKKPGLIHNFKNFSWIDFLIHSDKKDVLAHIRCNGKIHSASFKVENFFLSHEDGSSEKAYLVKLKNLELIGEDQGSTQREVHEPELPTPMSMPDLSQTTPTIEPKPQAISSEMIMPEEIAQPDQIAVSTPEPTQTIEMDLQELQVDNEPLELMEEASTEPVPDILTQTTQPSLDESTQYSDYIYNPTLAADELGLPADLIDEFVGDFIIQAKKFQPDMESAVTNSDFDTVQILSHKLKGVAANLRIEDALEVLNVINSSKDPVELKTHIAYLTSIISKLEFGDQAPITPEASTSIETEPESQSTGYEAKPDDDIYDFNLVQNSDSKEQEYQKLSALVEELSHDEEVEEELPDLVVHEDAIHEEPVMQEEYPVIQEPIFEEPTELDYEIPVMTESTKSVIEEPIQEPIEETLPNKVEEEIHFDPEQTAKELGMDSSELNTYIQEFVDQANSLKTELENALKSRNFETVRSIASELKGASEALHMDYASQLLTHMQTSDEIRFTIEKAKAFFIFVRQL